MKKLLKYFVPFLLFVPFLFVSCEYEYVVPEELPPVDTTEVISFSITIEPIFTDQSCINCHSSGGFNLTQGNAYKSIVPSKVNLADPELSEIYTKPHPDDSHYEKYSPLQAQNILIWITQGAIDN